MDITVLKKFLVEANEKGYADGDESRWTSNPDGSTTITYESHDFTSHDNFFGGEPYGGRQVIFFQKKPVWIMVYYGAVSPSVADPNIVYPFLRKALSARGKDDLYQGPKEFIGGFVDQRKGV